jgi:hypothetical protein
MKKIDYFDVPTQVTFLDEEDNRGAGIAYRDEVICLCCGATIPLHEVIITSIAENVWVDLSRVLEKELEE